MSNRTRSIIIFSAGVIFGIFIISQTAFRENEKNEKANQMTPKQQFYLPDLPDEFTFAGEKVPLDRCEVSAAFERELIYSYNNPGHISYILKLSKRYFPIIEERLKATEYQTILNIYV